MKIILSSTIPHPQSHPPSPPLMHQLIFLKAFVYPYFTQYMQVATKGKGVGMIS